MNKPPFMEMNACPSRLNTSPSNAGAAKQMNQLLIDSPNFDGVTNEQMQNNPLYDRHLDSIDKIGVAQKKVVESAKVVKSKAKMIRGLNDLSQRLRKPTTKS